MKLPEKVLLHMIQSYILMMGNKYLLTLAEKVIEVGTSQRRQVLVHIQ